MATKKRKTTKRSRSTKRAPKKGRKKASGRRGGRPKGSRVAGSKSERIRELLSSGMTAAEIAEKVGCSTNLVYVVKSQSGAAGSKRRSRRARRASPQTDGLHDLASAIKELQRERDELRRALERISTAVEAALR